jgi:hypothetical protein
MTRFAAIGLLSLLALVPVPSAAQSPLPSARGDIAASCGNGPGAWIKLGIADTTEALAFQGREALPFDGVNAPADLREAPLLDVLGGSEIPISVTLADEARAPIGSLMAVLVLPDRRLIWLGPYGPEHPYLTTPLGAEGSGVLHVLVGTCDDWTFTASWPITIADPAAAADCPTDLEGLHASRDAMDQRVIVAGTTVDSMGLRGGVIGRYVPVQDDQATFVGYDVTPHERPIRLKAGERFTVRAHDRSIDVPKVFANFSGYPTAQELRSGWIETLPRPRIEGRARLDGQGGFTVLAPRKPGRYLLLLNPVWRNACLTTQDAQMVLSVVVR